MPCPTLHREGFREQDPDAPGCVGLQTSHWMPVWNIETPANYIKAKANVGTEVSKTRCPIPPVASRTHPDHRSPPGRKEGGVVGGDKDCMCIQMDLNVCVGRGRGGSYISGSGKVYLK